MIAINMPWRIRDNPNAGNILVANACHTGKRYLN